MNFESHDGEERDLVPTGEKVYDIQGETLTASEILSRSDELLDNLSDDEGDARVKIEMVLERAENRFQIITLADANKRRARELFYHVISEFETQLSSIIKSHYPDSFVPEADEDEIERWYRAKIDELEIHIAEHMHLSTLLTVGGKNEDIRENFGFSSRNQFDKQLGGLNSLRNKVMHPTRALVHDLQDLEDQVDRIRRARDALQHLDREQIQPEYPRGPGE